MTKEECKNIAGLTTQERNVINRLWWHAAKNGTECKLEKCTTPEEVLNVVRATFRKPHTEAAPEKQVINLNALSIEELEDLMTKIPAIIEKKKAEKLAEIDAEIEKLKALKKELNK